MPRLILLLAVAVVLYLMYRRVRTVPPHNRRAEYIKLGLAAAVAIVLVLTLTGRSKAVANLEGIEAVVIVRELTTTKKSEV